MMTTELRAIRCCSAWMGAKASLVGSTDCISQPVVGMRLEEVSFSTPRELTAIPEPSKPSM